MKYLPIEFGDDRYAPSDEFSDEHFIPNQRKLAFWVGCIAVGLPVLLMIASTFFGVCNLDSISHYFYSKYLGVVFVGCIVFLGAFLVAYKGQSTNESIVANIAGLATLGVAIFPTSGSGCDGGGYASRGFSNDVGKFIPEQAFQLFPNAEYIHYACAAFVLLFLAFYTLFVFTRVDEKAGQRISSTELSWQKKIRNRIYKVSGALIVISVFSIFLGFLNEPDFWDTLNLTFVFESIAFVAFGISWLVKARFRFFGMLDLNDVGGSRV